MTDALARVEHAAVSLLVFLGVALIGVPLVLTLYLSVFDEKLILFPPHAYTLDWYHRDPGDLRRVDLDQPAARHRRHRRQPAAGRARRHWPVPPSLPRQSSISTLLLAPITVPGIALGLAVYIVLVFIDDQRRHGADRIAHRPRAGACH